MGKRANLKQIMETVEVKSKLSILIELLNLRLDKIEAILKKDIWVDDDFAYSIDTNTIIERIKDEVNLNS